MAKNPNRSSSTSQSYAINEDKNAQLTGGNNISAKDAAIQAMTYSGLKNPVSATSSGGGGSSVDYNAIINQAYNEQKAALDQRLSAMQAERQALYDRMAEQYKLNFDDSEAALNDAIGRSLQEAYIAKMLNQRDLQQMLSAQGITGGASETTAASLLNAYSNARNNLERSRAEQLKSLLADYNNNLNTAYSNLVSGNLSDLNAYYDALVSAIGTKASNTLNAAMSASSSGSGGSVDSRTLAAASAIKNLQNGIKGSGSDKNDAIVNALTNQGYTADEIDKAALYYEKYLK